jgi:monovalent cation/hydrogen antiporter
VLGLANAGGRELRADRIEERKARRRAAETAIERFDQLAEERSLPEDIVKPLRAAQRARLLYVEMKGDGAEARGALADVHDEVELQLIEAERQLINDLYYDGALKDEARRRIERELDLREARLASRQDEE